MPLFFSSLRYAAIGLLILLTSKVYAAITVFFDNPSVHYSTAQLNNKNLNFKKSGSLCLNNDSCSSEDGCVIPKGNIIGNCRKKANTQATNDQLAQDVSEPIQGDRLALSGDYVYDPTTEDNARSHLEHRWEWA